MYYATKRSQVDEDEKPQAEKKLHWSELVGQLKSALKEGAIVVSSPGLNPQIIAFQVSLLLRLVVVF